MLREEKKGYRMNNEIVYHLVYIDDIKIYGSTSKQATSLINTSALYMKAIELELGPTKCATTAIHKDLETT